MMEEKVQLLAYIYGFLSVLSSLGGLEGKAVPASSIVQQATTTKVVANDGFVGGIECTTQPAACIGHRDAWSQIIANVETRIGCNEYCSQHHQCNT